MDNVFSGKTIEDAISNGLKALNITLVDAEIAAAPYFPAKILITGFNKITKTVPITV